MKVEGNVENIVFRNESNGWTVLRIKNSKTVFTLVGNIVRIDVGDSLEAEVSEYNHPDYGLQYKIEKYNIYMPNEDEDAIYKFLVSLSVKGVGDATVRRLIENFGVEVLNVIKDAPEKLYGIKGMTETRINSLREKIIERSNEIDIILELEKYELGAATIKKILAKYGNDTLKVIEENPYKLAIEIDGIGFNICDKIAKLNGYEEDSVKRVMAGIMFVLENDFWQGNVFSYRQDVIDRTIELLDLSSNYNFDDAFIIWKLTLRLKLIRMIIRS